MKIIILFQNRSQTKIEFRDDWWSSLLLHCWNQQTQLIQAEKRATQPAAMKQTFIHLLEYFDQIRVHNNGFLSEQSYKSYTVDKSSLRVEEGSITKPFKVLLILRESCVQRSISAMWGDNWPILGQSDY